MAWIGRIIPRFSSDVWRFLFYWGMVSFGYFGIFGVLFNLYLLRLGYGPEFIGFLLGMGQFVWAAFCLPAAAVGPRIGLKRSMLIGQGVVAVGSALVVATEALPADLRSLALLGVWMLTWVGVSLNVVNSVPYLMEISAPENRSTAFAYHSAVVGLLGFAGSLIAGAIPGLLAGRLGLSLEGPEPYRYALLLAPAAYLLGMAVLARARAAQAAPEDESHQPGGVRVPLGILVFFGVLIFLQSTGDGVVRAFFNIYLDTSLGVNTAQIGTLMGFAQLLPVATALFTPWLIGVLGLRVTLAVTSGLTAAFLLLIAVVPNLMGAAAGLMGVLGMGAIINTTRTIYGQMMVTPRWRATVSAISSVGLALAWGISAGLGGSVSGLVGFSGLFAAGALVVLLSVGLLLTRPGPDQPGQ
jgi:hypothetical protein